MFVHPDPHVQLINHSYISPILQKKQQKIPHPYLIGGHHPHPTFPTTRPRLPWRVKPSHRSPLDVQCTGQSSEKRFGSFWKVDRLGWEKLGAENVAQTHWNVCQNLTFHVISNVLSSIEVESIYVLLDTKSISLKKNAICFTLVKSWSKILFFPFTWVQQKLLDF